MSTQLCESHRKDLVCGVLVLSPDSEVLNILAEKAILRLSLLRGDKHLRIVDHGLTIIVGHPADSHDRQIFVFADSGPHEKFRGRRQPSLQHSQEPVRPDQESV